MCQKIHCETDAEVVKTVFESYFKIRNENQKFHADKIDNDEKCVSHTDIQHQLFFHITSNLIPNKDVCTETFMRKNICLANFFAETERNGK